MMSGTSPQLIDNITENSQSWLMNPILRLAQLNVFDKNYLNLIDMINIGLCVGFSYEAMLATLSGNKNSFISRINVIKDTNPVELAVLIKLSQLINIYYKQNPSKESIVIEDYENILDDHFDIFLDEEEDEDVDKNKDKVTHMELFGMVEQLSEDPKGREEWMEIYGLFQRILIAQCGNRYELSIQDPSIKQIAFGQNLDNMLDLIKPQGSIEIKKAAQFSNVYDEVLLGNFFSCFRNAMENIMVNQISFVLENREHNITISYYNKEKKWLYMNVSTVFGIPEENLYHEINDVDKLAELVILAFEKEKINYSICEINIYINQLDEIVMKTVWEKLNKMKIWEKVIEITPMQANAVDHAGCYLLYIAASHGETKNLPHLIEHTNNPNAFCSNFTPLGAAINHLHHDTVKILLENKKIECPLGKLHMSLKTRDKKITHLILDRLFLDGDRRDIDEIYNTLFKKGSLYDSYLCNILRSHSKFDINYIYVIDDQGETLLTLNCTRASSTSLSSDEVEDACLIIQACLNDKNLNFHSIETKTAIEQLAPISQNNIQDGLLSCYLIAIKNNDRIMKEFLDKTLNMELQSPIIKTRFQRAIKESNINELLLLLKIGAANHINTYYEHSSLTPLFIAIWDNNIPIVEMLLENKVDLNQSILESTALHVAVHQGNIKIIELLLSCGANINKQDNVGATPLYTAVKFNDTNIAKFLIAQNADIFGSVNGKNLSDLALRNNDAEMLLFFLKKDVKLSENIKNKNYLSIFLESQNKDPNLNKGVLNEIKMILQIKDKNESEEKNTTLYYNQQSSLIFKPRRSSEENSEQSKNLINNPPNIVNK